MPERSPSASPLSLRALSIVLAVIAVGLVMRAAASDLRDELLLFYRLMGAVLGHALEEGGEGAFIFPYVDFPFEYPPMTVFAAVLPRLFTDTLEGYSRLFAAEMLLLVVAMGWMLWLLSRRVAAQPLDGWQTLALMSALAIGANWFIARRFDAVPAFFAAAAVLAEVSRRSLLAGVLVGLGAATKLWPGFLLPLLLLAALRDRDTRRGVLLVVGAAGGFLLPHLPFLLFGGVSAFSYLGYHGARGIQLESVWGNAALLLSKLTPLETSLHYEFGATNVVSASGWTNALTWLSYAAMLGAFGLIFQRTFVRCRQTSAESVDRARVLVTGSAALVLALLATSKILSPQFVLWLFPLAFAVPREVGGRPVWIGALVVVGLTGIEFPYYYFQHVQQGDLSGTLLVFVRNLVLLGVTWAAIRAISRPAASR